jgi:hypothetical protein
MGNCWYRVCHQNNRRATVGAFRLISWGRCIPPLRLRSDHGALSCSKGSPRLRKDYPPLSEEYFCAAYKRAPGGLALCGSLTSVAVLGARFL